MQLLSIVLDDTDFEEYCNGTMSSEHRVALVSIVSLYRLRGVEIVILPLSIASWRCFTVIARLGL